jgi:hypothetical protein
LVLPTVHPKPNLQRYSFGLRGESFPSLFSTPTDRFMTLHNGDMDLGSSEYQRVRLWSGIVSIGFNLSLIGFLAITSAWWSLFLGNASLEMLSLCLVAVGIPLANLPFDLLSGFANESALKKTAQSQRGWFRDWMVGRGLTAVGLFFSFFLFWWNHSTAGSFVPPILTLASVVLLAGLLVIPTGFRAPPQSGEFRYEGFLRDELKMLNSKVRDVHWFDNGDLRFVNGFISPFGLLCLSTTVSIELTPREAALLAAREEWFRKSGCFAVGSVIAVVWALLGFVFALFLPATSAVQAAMGGSAVVTGWCFLALFIWPSLNRRWMRKADCYLAKLAPHDEVVALLKKVQSLNATDVSLSRAKTTVFHPIPPLEERLRALS